MSSLYGRDIMHPRVSLYVKDKAADVVKKLMVNYLKWGSGRKLIFRNGWRHSGEQSDAVETCIVANFNS